MLQEHRAIGLIPTRDGSALAAILMINMRTGNLQFVWAKTVMKGTSGGSTMYKYHTPSGGKAMNGLAMTLRVGLPPRDMEVVQSQPAGLLAGNHIKMTETVPGPLWKVCTSRAKTRAVPTVLIVGRQ